MTQEFLCYLSVEDGFWTVRVDKQLGDGKHHQRHVHVSRKKLKGEYAWNVDGTRHDKGRFPVSEDQIKKAKELASKALGIPADSLQLVHEEMGGNWVSILLRDGEQKLGRRVFFCYVRKNEVALFIGTDSGGLAVLIVEV